MASNAQHSPRRKGKSKQYGSLQNLGTRERSESPRHTPRSSSSIRIRTPPPLKDTGECSSGNSPARQGSPKPCSRHVSNSSVMSLPDSPIHPPNLTHARRRIVSSESVASTLSLDSVNSLDSIKSSPDKYQPGLSPLECCLCCYPVMVSVLKHIPTPDVLALRRVSKMFKEHMEQNYTRHLLDICLVKDRNWLYRVYRPKAPSEKLEMDGVYQYQREFAFLKVAEEDAVLRHARVLYDSEVTFMVLRELAPYDAIPLFVSGGGRKVVDPDLMKKLCFRNPREFWDSLDFSENSAVCKAESTLPHNFFYHKINGVYLVKMLEHALTELVRVGLTRDFRFLRTLVIDGTGVTGDDLIHILQMYRLDEQLIGLSAIACPNVDLQVFLKMLEERRPRTLQWLKIYPSVEIPSMPFYYVSTSSGNDEHKHRTVNFHRCMTVQEHLDITLPLICSSNPNIEDKVTYAMRAEALMSYRQVLRGSMSSVWLQTQQVHMLKTMHPALKLIALCKARGVDLDFNFCASGIRCFTWKVEEERRKRGDPGVTLPYILSYTDIQL
ncbi:hypothetical protein BDZ91DRAFT_130036 [Kalaharituber pfeilii]|nr:hypothetical protein BDZ91DRAFT_130036 [Kalaharituber pfeilii]